MEFGVYIHIPFCQQKCFYCDFPSFAGRERFIDDYLLALKEEIHKTKSNMGYGQDEKLQPKTLYIGGGTPTVLAEEQLEKLFQLIHEEISLDFCEEYTIEVNPGTVNENKLKLLKNAGITRLSIGVQSLDDKYLQAIGRIHNAQEAVDTVHLAQLLGLNNISIDLMYGLPGQTMAVLQETLRQALKLKVQHISIYGLQLEEGTAFAKMEAIGKLQLPADEITEAMYDYITSELPQQGYERYEISNFAQKGFYSRHNMSYWQDKMYLGFGSGAHSYWQGKRLQNLADIPSYIKAVPENNWQELEEQVSEKEHMEEMCFLGLRTAEGINKKQFSQTFGRNLEEIYGDVIIRLTEKGLLKDKEDSCSLTPLGMRYGNQVFSEFLL